MSETKKKVLTGAVVALAALLLVPLAYAGGANEAGAKKAGNPRWPSW